MYLEHFTGVLLFVKIQLLLDLLRGIAPRRDFSHSLLWAKDLLSLVA